MSQRIIRIAGIIGTLVCATLGAFLVVTTQRTEPALFYACEVAAYEQVADDCLEIKPVPQNRTFDTVSDRSIIAGLWVTRPMHPGEMVHLSQFTDKPPDRFRFAASGEELPVGVWGYFLELPEQVLSKVDPGDFLTLSITDPVSEQLIAIFDKAAILDETGDGLFLGLTMEQIAAIQRLLLEQIRANETDEKDDLPELVWAITQGANPDLPPLAVFRMELDAGTLSGGSR